MKERMKRISEKLRIVFGYGVMLSLFAGGLTFFGYAAALVIGGEIAAEICKYIYKTIIPIIIRTSTTMVLLGLLVMYLNGEMALTTGNKKKAVKHQGEI